MIQQHQTANQSYPEEGARLFDLANRAYDLFGKQPLDEKRRPLNFVLPNCTWKGGELSAEFRQPFDMLTFTTMRQETKRAARGTSGGGPYKNWLLGQDSNLEFAIRRINNRRESTAGSMLDRCHFSVPSPAASPPPGSEAALRAPASRGLDGVWYEASPGMPGHYAVQGGWRVGSFARRRSSLGGSEEHTPRNVL
jgi:hypothetical protein